MLTVYNWENGALKEATDISDSCWIDLTEPTTAELERVLTKSGVPRDFLTDPLDKDERPRYDVDDGAHLLIIHVPFQVQMLDDDALPYQTIPLGIILFGRSVITICGAQTPVTAAFLDQIRRVCPPSEQFRFAFRLLWHSAVLFLRYLHDIYLRSEAIEQDLHQSISNEALLRLFTIEKTLVYFTTSLKADNILMTRLGTLRSLSLSEDDRDILDDAAVEYLQAMETATIHSNILTGTLDTFASLINNNLNNVMKYLTVATIILAVPTLITSAFGMNVSLPLSATIEGCHPHAFAIIMAMCGGAACTVIGLLFYLYRKRVF